MAKLRYVKTPDQIARAMEDNPEFLRSTVRSIRCVYRTDPELARAVVPQPLEVTAEAEVAVTFSEVAIHLSEDFIFEIGSGVFGVRVRYEDIEGSYLITMPMTTEQAVIPGRETYGEPKKIAAIDFNRDGDSVSSEISRMGITYLEAKGTLGKELGPREFTEYGYCFKAMPSCEQGKAFDADPLLVRLEWRHEQTAAWTLDDAALNLFDSPFDPVADLPLRELVTAEYEEGSSQSNGRVLRSVPGEWLLPFLHQRYDDTSGDGVEIAIAS